MELRRRCQVGGRKVSVERNPNITLRTPASLSKSRAMATNEEVIDQYFNIMEEALIKKFIR